MTSPMIRVCSLTLGYGDRTVLKNISFDVAAGAVFAGAMYYFFKKQPSENNPGQVKLAEF